MQPVLAVTSGEPAGVGPELCARLAEKDWLARLVVLGDIDLIRERAALTGRPVEVQRYEGEGSARAGCLEVLHLPLAVASKLGMPDPANARYVLDLLDRALAGCASGEFAGMITAPVN